MVGETGKTDELLEEIAQYAVYKKIDNLEAFETARHVLMDALGCGILALRFPECTKLLGPIVPGTVVPNGVHVLGTPHVLDPVQAAFNIGCMIRWLDYNDTWLAAEWGHPSDNLASILATAEYVSRQRISEGKPSLTIKDVLEATIKAHEIQGILALENSLNRHGLDHVLFVKVASTAVVTAMLGGGKEEVINALSNAWIDLGSLRTYRHAPNAGSRKSWAAADASSRAVRLALMAMKGEMGYKTALSAPIWGFQDVILKGKPMTLARELDSYVMENVLFKVAYPAEFHAQTAAESAIILHTEVEGRLDDIERVEITTHESAVRIIDKTGPLQNAADRDHCLQYITAIGLIDGQITADHYEDAYAADPRIDLLRAKMVVTEEKQYSIDYMDPDKRSITNAVQVFFNDGTATEKVEIEYPIGHRRRREEALPLLFKKAEDNFVTHYSASKVKEILALFVEGERLKEMPLINFMAHFQEK